MPADAVEFILDPSRCRLSHPRPDRFRRLLRAGQHDLDRREKPRLDLRQRPARSAHGHFSDVPEQHVPLLDLPQRRANAAAIASSTSPSFSPILNSPVRILTRYFGLEWRQPLQPPLEQPPFRDWPAHRLRSGRKTPARPAARNASGCVRPSSISRAVFPASAYRCDTSRNCCSVTPLAPSSARLITAQPVFNTRQSPCGNTRPVKNSAAAASIRVVQRRQLRKILREKLDLLQLPVLARDLLPQRGKRRETPRRHCHPHLPPSMYRARHHARAMPQVAAPVDSPLSAPRPPTPRRRKSAANSEANPCSVSTRFGFTSSTYRTRSS